MTKRMIDAQRADRERKQKAPWLHSSKTRAERVCCSLSLCLLQCWLDVSSIASMRLEISFPVTLCCISLVLWELLLTFSELLAEQISFKEGQSSPRRQ